MCDPTTGYRSEYDSMMTGGEYVVTADEELCYTIDSRDDGTDAYMAPGGAIVAVVRYDSNPPGVTCVEDPAAGEYAWMAQVDDDGECALWHPPSCETGVCD